MIVTFGHSTLDLTEGIRLLDSAGVDILIDVRSHPTSRFEQWRRESLARWLPKVTQQQIRYAWWPELGGWDIRHAQDEPLREFMLSIGVDLAAYSRGAFPKQRIGKNRVFIAGGGEGDPAWTNQGLYDYAWFTTLDEFNDGIDRLIEMFGGPDKPTCAIMCCEAVWWRCHRSMISDVLVARGSTAHHIQPRWTDHRDAIGNRIDRYPASVRASWRGCTPTGAHLEARP